MAPLSSTASEFDPKSLLNTTIDKRSIQLVSVLGAGAYGVVYLGVHVPTSTRYAVKLLTNPEAIKTEIELHSQVSDHPSVLTLEKVIHENGRVFLVLEYASGGDLFSAITQQQGVTGNNYAIRYIFLQILDAVQYCHDNGIAHRDLKPENILMFPRLIAKLADFGLATTKCVSNEFGCGSSFYFSPECQGQQLDKKQTIKGYSTRQNDVWSLGVILVNLAVGRNPWRQATLKDTAFATYCKNPHKGFFKQILPTVSDALADLLVRIFTLDPAHRISLLELRVHVAAIDSFTTRNVTIKGDSCCTIRTPAAATKKRVETMSYRSPAPEIDWTNSLFHTVCDYASGFEEEDDEEEQPIKTARRHVIMPSYRPVALPPMTCLPPTPCFSTSPCSSVSSLDTLTTPHQQQQQHLSTAATIGEMRKIDMPMSGSLSCNGSPRYHVFYVASQHML